MTSHLFSTDKDISLKIIKNICNRLKNENDVCVRDDFDYRDFYGEKPDNYEYKSINLHHKLAIVELHLEGYNDKDDLAIVDDKFYTAIEKKEYDRSNCIEIYQDSKIIDDDIFLTSYLHETSTECDISYPSFTYDDKYKCWIIKDDFWGAKNGINCNGIVTILDFSDYTNNKENECNKSK